MWLLACVVSLDAWHLTCISLSAGVSLPIAWLLTSIFLLDAERHLTFYMAPAFFFAGHHGPNSAKHPQINLSGHMPSSLWPLISISSVNAGHHGPHSAELPHNNLSEAHALLKGGNSEELLPATNKEVPLPVLGPGSHLSGGGASPEEPASKFLGGVPPS